MQEPESATPEPVAEALTAGAAAAAYAAQLQFDRPPQQVYHFRKHYSGSLSYGPRYNGRWLQQHP